MFNAIDWHNLLVPSTPILEIALRGALTYFGLFALLRVVLKRQSGPIGISDLLVIVLIADAASNAMADDYRSVPDGLLLVLAILISSYFLDWIGYRFSKLEKFVYPTPLPLVSNGRMNLENMRKELITRSELMSMLRAQGIEDISEVKAASLEGSGELSVLKAERDKSGQ